MVRGPESVGRVPAFPVVDEVTREPREAERAHVVAIGVEPDQVPVPASENHRVGVDDPLTNLPM